MSDDFIDCRQHKTVAGYLMKNPDGVRVYRCHGSERLETYVVSIEDGNPKSRMEDGSHSIATDPCGRVIEGYSYEPPDAPWAIQNLAPKDSLPSFVCP